MDQLQVGKRLAQARQAAGYDSAKRAAEAMGVPIATYIQHENGTRGFRAPTAERYAKRFKTTPEWILYAKGDMDPEPSEAVIEEMLREALQDVVTLQTRLSDLPHIVAPALHERLERYRSGAVELWIEREVRRDTAQLSDEGEISKGLKGGKS